MEHTTDIRTTALAGGIGYLVIFISGIYANFFVLENLVIREDAGQSWENLLAGMGQFQTALLAFLLMVIFDLLLTWALYVIFRPVSRDLSILVAWFRLVNVALFGAALTYLFDIRELLLLGDAAAAYPEGQLPLEVLRSMAGFDNTWLFGLVFFGIHLLGLGTLIWRSGFVPRFIGLLLAFAGLGYLIDSFAQFFLASYTDYADVFALVVILPGVVGELSLTIWLLWKGIAGRG